MFSIANSWPGKAGFSTTNTESPRWALERSGSVRARTISTLARPAKVHDVFTPDSRHTLPSRRAVALILALSEP
jgi:hypothetical protein